MFTFLLAQAAQNTPPQYSAKDESLLYLYMIIIFTGVGVLMVIGLVASWRNHLNRQRDIEEEHEERDADLPRPDAWATAAQRISPDDANPDEAHVAPYTPEEDFDTEVPGEEDDDDVDDFPFGQNDDDSDDDGPIGRP